MMAGHKQWTSGELVTAADMQSYLQNQVIGTYADAPARDAAIPVPVDGQHAWLIGPAVLTRYQGGLWRAVGAGGGLPKSISPASWDITAAGSDVKVPGLSVQVQGPISVWACLTTVLQHNGTPATIRTLRMRLVTDSNLGSTPNYTTHINTSQKASAITTQGAFTFTDSAAHTIDGYVNISTLDAVPRIWTDTVLTVIRA